MCLPLIEIRVKATKSFGKTAVLPMVTSLNNIHFHRHGNSIMHRCVILVEICPIPRENFLHTPTYIFEKKNLVISIKSFKRCLKDGYFIDWLISKETHETCNIID